MEGVRGVGLATRSIVSVCCAIQLSVFVFDVPLGQFTLSAARVLHQHELYRICLLYTSPSPRD